MPTDFDTFVQNTGINISRATYYRMKHDYVRGSHIARPSGDHTKRGADARPFLAYDGEGITLEGQHKYVLLACSNGQNIYNPKGLSTRECLDFLLRSQHSRAIRIFYSFGYDVQQMLCDLPDELLVQVMHGQMVRYGPYRLSYMPGKIFVVNNIRFMDVFSFWQKSFIAAVTESLGAESVSQSLVEGKQSRSNFSEWNVRDILKYTNEELVLLLRLADHLREILLRADIHLGASFYGPGAIANYWFRQNKIAPPAITDAKIVDIMERAYYGGRFETFQLGKVDPVYELDINSAYPSILTSLPYLDGWHTARASEYKNPTTTPFSVWHVEWHIGGSVGPLPSRDKHGLICYPANGRGWYWKTELEAAIALYGESCYQILEGIVPSIIEGQPFQWVEGIYDQRQQLRLADDPAEYAFKIGLNSLYGKTAQRVGKAKYFSLAWAGSITAGTRAKLLYATARCGTEAIVAYATDALYTTKLPTGIDTGKRLGQFSLEVWERGYFIQSGVYRLERAPTESDLRHTKRITDNGCVRKDAYRGYQVSKGIQDIFDQIINSPHEAPFLYVTKFVGHLEAIKCPKALGPHRLCFITMRKQIEPYKTTKRKILDSSIWLLVEDGDWIEPGLTRSMAATLGIREGAIPVFHTTGFALYHTYDILLDHSIRSSILHNHNDHSNYVVQSYPTELEESYPFIRVTSREDDLGLSAVDDVAVERIGGALGIIPSRFANKLPIVDEDDILKELQGG